MLRYLSRADIRSKRVILRVDFNVPIEKGKIGDYFRLEAALPTIRRLLGGRNSLVVMSHHSRRGMSLYPLAVYLSRVLRQRVIFLRRLPAGGRRREPDSREAGVFLLENLRFWPGEETESWSLARRLAALGDVFVNDAFGVAHRRGASLTLLPKLLPSYTGLLLEKEIKNLDSVLDRPKRPLVAVFGGAKVETKLPILKRFSKFADRVLVGGVIANVFLKMRGSDVGASPVDFASERAVRNVVRSKKLILPVDVVVAKSRAAGRGRVAEVGAIKKGEIILDAGPATRSVFRRVVKSAGTVVWNGPLGLIEKKAFAGGTLALARALAVSRAKAIVGGGDSIAFLDQAGLLKKFKHVSTGGGAMLAYLAGEKLPALEALRRSRR